VPELPEVETIARGLSPGIAGARVRSVWWSGLGLHLGRPVDVALLRRTLLGKTLLGVRRRGKYLLVDARGPRRPGMLVHLGMSGRLVLAAAGAPRAPHTHLVLGLGLGRGGGGGGRQERGARELRFVDPRRFGWITAGAPLDARPELAGLGPDPLTELDEATLAARLAGVRAPIKAFLLDQRRIAGVGNIYVSEALFRARMHPGTPGDRVRHRAGALLGALRAALESGIRNRGTTLRDYVDSSGAPGDNAAALLVYGREGAPCPTCRASIRRRTDSGRSTFFCARCQRR
jgi:formamidopyrimidine-DNA glycosylase